MKAFPSPALTSRPFGTNQTADPGTAKHRLSRALEKIRTSHEIDHRVVGENGAVTGLCETGCEAVVLAAVSLSRLNSEDAYVIVDALAVVEQEHAAILRAPRLVAEWLRDEGTYVVLNADQSPEPVQIVEADVEHSCLETAVVLWEPFDSISVYCSFEVALSAATRLCEDK